MAEFDRNKLIAEAKAKRAQIEAAAAALSDEQAYERAWMFPLWDGGGHAYAEGERVQYGGVLYRCLTGHTSQDSWRPDTAPSLIMKQPGNGKRSARLRRNPPMDRKGISTASR